MSGPRSLRPSTPPRPRWIVAAAIGLYGAAVVCLCAAAAWMHSPAAALIPAGAALAMAGRDLSS